MIPIPPKKLLEAYKELTPTAVMQQYLSLVAKKKFQQAEMLKNYACYWHLDLFIYFYLPEIATHPFADYHRQILNAIPHGTRNVRINILAPRGSAKTTLMTLVYPLHRILYAPFDKIMGFPTEKFITIITFSEENSMDRIRSIIYVLETNNRIKKDFGDRKTQTLWGVKGLHVQLNTEDEVCYVKPVTRGQQIRGKLFFNTRPTLIIIDDIDEVLLLQNPNNRINDQSWLFSDVMPAGEPEMTNYIMIDTLKHEESLAAILRERPGWYTIFLRAVEYPERIKPHPTAEALWERFENLYTNRLISDADRLQRTQEFYQEHQTEMESNVVTLWPERIKYVDLRKAIIDDGYDFVLREYQNDISYTTFRVFNMDKASRFRINPEGFLVSDHRLEDEDGVRQVFWKELVGISIYHDWAGGRDIFKNDFSAIAMVAWSKRPAGVAAPQTIDSMNGQYGYVLQVSCEREPQDKQIRRIFNMAEWAMDTLIEVEDMKVAIGFERIIDSTGTATDAYLQTFRQEKEKRGQKYIDLYTRPIDSVSRKETRIDTLVGPVAYGHLSFHEDIDNEFIRQMSQYPTGDYDDGPDALQGAIRSILRPATTNKKTYIPADGYRIHPNRQNRLRL